MTNGMGLPVPGVTTGATGRRSFSEAEKRRIVDETSQLGASVAMVARRYGIAPRVLFRWKEAFKPEPAPAVAVFAPVQITDPGPVVEVSASVPSGAGIEVELIGGRRVRFERDAESRTCARGWTVWRCSCRGTLQQDPFSGHLFAFRGRRADLIKIVFWDGSGLCLFTKRLEQSRFFWPVADEATGSVMLTQAQLSMLIEGVDWRSPEKR